MARAEDIPQIELTRDGPKSLLPLKKPFYLKMTPPETTAAVQLVFVRYAYRPFGRHPWRYEREREKLKSRPPVSCSEVQQALSGGVVGVPTTAPEEASAPRIPPGHRNIVDIWLPPTGPADRQRYNHLERYAKALVLDRQEITKDSKTAAFLVHDPGFFLDGAMYCMFVYEHRKIAVGEELYQAIRDVVLNPSGEPKEFLRERLKKRTSDEQQLEKFLDELGKELLNVGQKMRTAAVRAHLLVANWSRTTRSDRLPKFDGPVEIAREPFARIVAELLVHHGHLSAERSKDSVIYGFNGRKYTLLRFIGDLEAVELVPSPAPAESTKPAKSAPQPKTEDKPAAVRLTVAILGLKLPESDATLRDVVEFSRGALRIGGVYYRGEALVERIKDELKFDRTGPAASPQSRELMTYTHALDEVVDRALKARGGAASGPDYVYTPLGQWLAARLADCKQLADAAGGPALFDEELCHEPGKISWPGFADCPKDQPNCGKEGSLDPIHDLRSRLAIYFESLERWDKFKSALDQTIDEFGPTASYSIPSLALEMSVDSWTSSHITPVVGGAGIVTAHEPFLMPYVGAQLFLWPNPVDRPMWTNGFATDLRRLVGFELGLGIPRDGRTGFGPGDRYRNTGLGLPPVLLGVVLQPIPYVTASVGVAFMRVRQTELSGEIDRPYRALYVNFAFQLNFINAVRKLFAAGDYTQARKVFE